MECKACKGEGVQLSYLDGLKHVCPSCHGSGQYVQPYQIIPMTPSPWPVYPSLPIWPGWGDIKITCTQNSGTSWS